MKNAFKARIDEAGNLVADSVDEQGKIANLDIAPGVIETMVATAIQEVPGVAAVGSPKFDRAFSTTLSRDDAALSAAMDTCTLTIFSNDDGSGKCTVQADITHALRGFWYVLYGSDDLATWTPVASGTYESGTPAAQGQGTVDIPVTPVTLSIVVTPGDSGAGAKRFYKVVTGATNTPLNE